jgi:hypothetical protein
MVVFILLAAALVIPYVYASIGGSSDADPTANRQPGYYNCITNWAWQIGTGDNPGDASVGATSARFQKKYGWYWNEVFTGSFYSRSNSSIPASTYWNGDDYTFKYVELLNDSDYRWYHYDWNITGANIGGPWNSNEHPHSTVHVEQ